VKAWSRPQGDTSVHVLEFYPRGQPRGVLKECAGDDRKENGGKQKQAPTYRPALNRKEDRVTGKPDQGKHEKNTPYLESFPAHGPTLLQHLKYE